MRSAARVVGVGSPHGDDQVGWRVVEDLTADETSGMDAVAISDPVSLLGYLDDCDLLIVVDACRSGHPPGRVMCLPWPMPRPGGQEGRSTHGIGVASALTLAGTLGRLPPAVVLVVVEVESCEPASGLSPAVRRVLPEIRRRIMEIITAGPGSDLLEDPAWARSDSGENVQVDSSAGLSNAVPPRTDGP